MSSAISRFSLYLAHALYSLVLIVSTQWRAFRPKQPLPLLHERSRLPKNLALVLAAPSDEDNQAVLNTMLESVERTSKWCRQLGIPKLIIYDKQGIMQVNSDLIRERCLQDEATVETDSDIEYPLTPPASDKSESRPTSPGLSDIKPNLGIVQVTPESRLRSGSLRKGTGVLKRRRPSIKEKKNSVNSDTIIQLISSKASKAGIASVSQALFESAKRNSSSLHNITVNNLETILEGPDGLQPPDFMIIHDIIPSLTKRSFPLEFYGFPPWHIRLTEFYATSHQEPYLSLVRRQPTSGGYLALDEIDFRRALDSFSKAEMRLGR